MQRGWRRSIRKGLEERASSATGLRDWLEGYSLCLTNPNGILLSCQKGLCVDDCLKLLVFRGRRGLGFAEVGHRADRDMAGPFKGVMTSTGKINFT